MKLSSRPSGTPSRLSDSLHHQLSMYALAATAAGVSGLALAPPAEGKIIYTKTDVNVFSKSGYPLNLNHGRTAAEFTFMGTYFNTCCTILSSLKIVPGSANKVVWDAAGTGAAALKAGISVGPHAKFMFGPALMGLFSGTYYRDNRPAGQSFFKGSWENDGNGVTNRYLGLKFKISGKLHYGWARLNFPDPTGATLTGYAYETVPNKPIITGKTKGPDVVTMEPDIARGSLGSLALGRK